MKSVFYLLFILILWMVVLILWMIGCSQNQRLDRKLPVYGNTIYIAEDTLYHTIEDFELIDQDSNIVNNETFLGKVYIADFFFTSCPTICPVMKKQMLRVYERYEDYDEVAFLSHTIDPEYDTIALLKDYADRLGVDSEKWKFVTGDQDYIYYLGESSYMVMVDEDIEAPGGFIHSGAFLLVDKEKRIRGIYDGTVEREVNILMEDIKTLLRE